VTISLDILRLAQSFAAHAATRQQAIAQNIANADTPGYRSRDAVSFSNFWKPRARRGAATAE
jgi:flagellar basal-body rod protein FlgB